MAGVVVVVKIALTGHLIRAAPTARDGGVVAGSSECGARMSCRLGSNQPMWDRLVDRAAVFKRVQFATAVDWVARLTDAHRLGRLPAELARLRRYGLIIIDEVGYLPFEQDAANLVFQLVSSRYEHASLILTSNLPFSGWGGVFGDQAVAAAMIDRIVHHADVLTLKGASYRLRNRGIDTLPSIRTGADEPDA